MTAQQWLEEPTALPDAYTWPTWGALRERLLQSCKLIKCEGTPTVRDAFAAEVVQLSPSELTDWSVRRCDTSLAVHIALPKSTCGCRLLAVQRSLACAAHASVNDMYWRSAYALTRWPVACKVSKSLQRKCKMLQVHDRIPFKCS